MKTAVIIAAAGSSRRMGGSTPKQYLLLDNVPVLVRSVRAFYEARGLKQMILICPQGDKDFVLSVLEHNSVVKELENACVRLNIVEGGAQRQDSVNNALAAVDAEIDCVLIHDAARPFVSKELIDGVCDALEKGAQCALPGVTPKNTIRTADATLDRSSLYEVQTPQGFKIQCLKAAHQKAKEDGFYGTDDIGLAERAGYKAVITPGDYANIKITTPEDMPKMMRIGTGYDVHRLVEGRKLMLGCVEVPYEKGLLGHSDADVIAHAIADAMLGAAALGDIGKIFPDNADYTEGMAGKTILAETAKLLKNNGFSVINIDATLVAQKPKVSPYTEAMRAAVADAVGIPKSCVSIKATTEEGLGFTGDGTAMAAQAVCMIEQ